MAVAVRNFQECAEPKRAFDGMTETWNRLRKLGLSNEQIRAALDPLLKLLAL